MWRAACGVVCLLSQEHSGHIFVQMRPGQRDCEAIPAKPFLDDELTLSKPRFCRIHTKAADVDLQ